MNYVKLEIENGIGTIEFFTEKSNALPSDILADLAQKIHIAGVTEQVKIIILKSGGEKAFCAGASFDELLAINNAESGKKFFMGFANVINTIRKAPKFVIARVHGKAVGGGLGLAAASDYCIAHEKASGKLSELSIGIGPFVIEPALARKIGKSAVAQMSIRASQFYSAEWLFKEGLYSEVLESTEGLDQKVSELALELSTYSPKAMSELKKVFWEGTDHWDRLLESRALISGSLVLSEFTKNKLASFKN